MKYCRNRVHDKDRNFTPYCLQDSTTRVWDIRYLASALTVVRGRIGAVRSLRFSPDGNFLAMAEPADFVHLLDVKSDFSRSQEIDLFGEVCYHAELLQGMTTWVFGLNTWSKNDV